MRDYLVAIANYIYTEYVCVIWRIWRGGTKKKPVRLAVLRVYEINHKFSPEVLCQSDWALLKKYLVI